MAPFIDHSEYDKNTPLECTCGWIGKPEKCYSTLHAAFIDMQCPTCTEVVLVVDTLGTECGTFVPNHPPQKSRGLRQALANAFF